MDTQSNPMDDPNLPAEVQGFNNNAYRDWRHHPMSKCVFRYLADYRDAILKAHQLRWEVNDLFAEKKEMELQAWTAVLRDIIIMPPETIINFYVGQPEDVAMEAELQNQPKVQEEET